MKGDAANRRAERQVGALRLVGRGVQEQHPRTVGNQGQLLAGLGWMAEVLHSTPAAWRWTACRRPAALDIDGEQIVRDRRQDIRDLAIQAEVTAF